MSEPPELLVAPKNVLGRYQPPHWELVRSEYLVLWHGTTSLARRAIETRIDLAACAVDTDFGRGFYTTTVERQARLWAWEQCQRRGSEHPRRAAVLPVVLRFRVRRYSAGPLAAPRNRGLDSLSQLTFVRSGFESEDFWSLVQHCRSSRPAGPKGKPKEVVHHHRREPGGWYDLVAGPVAAFWEQRVAMADADQYSFHTPAAVEILDDLIAAGKGKGPDGRGDPNYYRWEHAT